MRRCFTAFCGPPQTRARRERCWRPPVLRRSTSKTSAHVDWVPYDARWLTLYQQWLTALADSARARAAEETEKRFSGRPNQVNGRPRRAVLRHASGAFTIPVSVEGTTNEYVFDTGAWHSVMTERRATRLGLKIDGTRRVLSGSSGQQAGFPTSHRLLVGLPKDRDRLLLGRIASSSWLPRRMPGRTRCGQARR
jgi:hypothetical protein